MNPKKAMQALALSLAMMVPASSGFAMTQPRHTHSVAHHHKHHSRTRGTVVGAAAGALIDHRHPLTGALIGAAAGNVIQDQRNKH